jgi:nucleoid DNA-binding protein
MKTTVGTVIKEVSDRTGVKETIAKDVVDSFLEVIVTNLENNKKVGLVGFGVFEPKTRKAHKRENHMGTGKSIFVHKKTRVIFSSASAVLNRLNDEKGN